MKAIVNILILSISNLSYGQFASNSQYLFAKEYSKEVSLYKAKSYVINDIIGKTTTPIKFEVFPLCGAMSGDLTTLVYKCEDKNLEGLIFGFYGDRWNDAGVIYKQYNFKNFPRDKAIILLNTIRHNVEDYTKYLREDSDNNNLYFQFEDVSFIIYEKTSGITLRVFWNDYDSEWAVFEFDKTLKRFYEKLHK